jgi:hypothetical protein
MLESMQLPSPGERLSARDAPLFPRGERHVNFASRSEAAMRLS